MSASDPQLDAVRHAFDGAFQRMCAAATVADLESELSNLLSQLYRLGELCKKRLGEKPFYALLASSNDLRAARAAMWARTFDTHDVVVVASPSDVFSDFFTAMFGVLAWKPMASFPQQTDKYGRHLDYCDVLEGQPVLDSMRRAFDVMAALL